MSKYGLSPTKPPPSDLPTATRMYENNECGFFCILNLVFALGCHYTDVIAPPERCETGELFFQRAKKLIDLDDLEHGDCTLVQALLLMGIFLQSTDRSEMCWNVIGLAIRMAQSVGLHDSEWTDAHDVNLDTVEVEMKKRLWGGCVLHDR